MCAEVNSRSALYQPLTEAELVRVVAAGLHTRPVSQKLLTGGLFNTTYLVNTAHCGKVVLRMGPVNRHLLMPFEQHLMESEAQVYDLLAQRGVAASEILAVDLSKTVVDRDFMFVRYLPSRAMSECDLAGEDRERVCRAIGEAAGRMHEICADRFGRVAAVSHGRGHARWSDALYADLLEWETVAAPAEIFPGEAHEEIRRLFRAAAPVLDEITSPQNPPAVPGRRAGAGRNHLAPIGAYGSVAGKRIDTHRPAPPRIWRDYRRGPGPVGRPHVRIFLHSLGLRRTRLLGRIRQRPRPGQKRRNSMRRLYPAQPAAQHLRLF